MFVDSEADPEDLKRLVNEVLEENRSKKKGKTELRLKALAGKAASTVCQRLRRSSARKSGQQLPVRVLVITPCCGA